jgi:hypothetical protein
MHKDYVMRTRGYGPFTSDGYSLIRIDGQSFPSAIHAMQYLKDECGFSINQAREYIESLPDGRVGIEI